MDKNRHKAPTGTNPSETARRRQRGRNWALCAALGGMAVLFYVLTFITMGGKV